MRSLHVHLTRHCATAAEGVEYQYGLGVGTLVEGGGGGWLGPGGWACARTSPVPNVSSPQRSHAGWEQPKLMEEVVSGHIR